MSQVRLRGISRPGATTGETRTGDPSGVTPSAAKRVSAALVNELNAPTTEGVRP